MRTIRLDSFQARSDDGDAVTVNVLQDLIETLGTNGVSVIPGLPYFRTESGGLVFPLDDGTFELAALQKILRRYPSTT